MEIDARTIENALANWYGTRANIIVPNVSWSMLPYEADMLVMTDAGYVTEIEIKVSRADLKRDERKRVHHGADWIKAVYFAVPAKLKDEVPMQYGVYAVMGAADHGCVIHEHRQAPVNPTARPLTPEERYTLARLAVMRVWSLRRRIKELLDQKEVHHGK